MWLININNYINLIIKTNKMRTRYKCPSCKQKTGVDIVYGLPNFEKLSQIDKSDLILGGSCFVTENMPERYCLNCKASWRIKRKGNRKENKS